MKTLLAIKAYLFSLPPVRAAAPENTLSFPFNQRWAMRFWSAVFNPDTRFDARHIEEPGMEPRRVSRRSAGALRRMPYAAQSRLCARQPQKIRRRRDGGLARVQHQFGQGHRRRRLEATRISPPIYRPDTRTGHGTASGPMGEAVDHSLSQLAPEDIRAIVAYLRSVPPTPSPDLPATTAPPAPASHKQGVDGRMHAARWCSKAPA